MSKVWEEKWRERQSKWQQFAATPIGAAFEKFERYHAWAWQKDTQLSFEACGEKSVKEAWKLSDQARRELLKLLGYEEPKKDV